MCKSFLGPFSGGGLLAGGLACRLDIFLHIPLHHKEGGAAALQKGLVEIQLGKLLPQRLLGLTAQGPDLLIPHIVGLEGAGVGQMCIRDSPCTEFTERASWWKRSRM